MTWNKVFAKYIIPDGTHIFEQVSYCLSSLKEHFSRYILQPSFSVWRSENKYLHSYLHFLLFPKGNFHLCILHHYCSLWICESKYLHSYPHHFLFPNENSVRCILLSLVSVWRYENKYFHYSTQFLTSIPLFIVSERPSQSIYSSAFLLCLKIWVYVLSFLPILFFVSNRKFRSIYSSAFR